jgi:hypothetical protein
MTNTRPRDPASPSTRDTINLLLAWILVLLPDTQNKSYFAAFITIICFCVNGLQLKHPWLILNVAFGTYLLAIGLTYDASSTATILACGWIAYYVSTGLVAFYAFRKASLARIKYFIVSWIWLQSAVIFCEAKGYYEGFLDRLHSDESHLFAWDPILRYRGLTFESSVVGGMLATFLTFLGIILFYELFFEAKRDKHRQVSLLHACGNALSFLTLALGVAVTLIVATKSSFAIYLASFSVLCFAMLFQRSLKAILTFGLLPALAALALIIALILPKAAIGRLPVLEYLQNEIPRVSLLLAYGSDATDTPEATGLATRVAGYGLAWESLCRHPLGVGPAGLYTAMEEGTKTPATAELEFYAARGVYGLKSIISDILAQGGVVGIIYLVLLLWIRIHEVKTGGARRVDLRNIDLLGFSCLAAVSVCVMVTQLYPWLISFVMARTIVARMKERLFVTHREQNPSAVSASGSLPRFVRSSYTTT